MKKNLFIISAALGLAAFSSSPSLQGEIETIRVKWLPTACQGSCAQGLAKQLSMMPGAAEVIVNQGQGMATIRWKPRVRFSYDLINTAMRLIGPAVQDVRLRVRGTVVATPSAVILQSLGDDTQFVLLSPAPGSLTEYVPQHSFNTHVLAPGTRIKFMEGQRDNTVVVVDGPLFEPQRMGGLYLIVEQATFNRLSKS